MLIDEEYTVKIEKLINEGKGLARINNIPVFVDNVCPEDIVRICIKKINKNYLVADVVEIIEPSKFRIKPICALSNICGSCNWQHIDYKEQLRQKENIVKETLKNITGIDIEVNQIIPSPKISEYRCKVQYPVSQKNSGRIIAGYYKKSSHELINIKYCPMQNPLINEMMEFIKEKAQELNITAYNERKHIGELRHIIFRLSSDLKNIIIIFAVNKDKIDTKFKTIADILAKRFPKIKGVCINFNQNKSNVIMGKKTQIILGDDYYIENISDKKFRISANSFFQVNPYCGELMFETVKKLIKENITNPTILDAYSGVSSFGIWLSDIASSVVCIEEVESASIDAKYNVELNNCKNIEIINGDAAKSFENLKKNNIKFDVSVIDPPRKGCDLKALENLISLTNNYIVYVSCNVSTLARDLKFLTENKFSPTIVQPIDMFPNTYHTEVITLLKKEAI